MKKKYCLSCMIIFISLFLTACNEDTTPIDDNNGKEDIGGIEDYTATTDVKTVELRGEWITGSTSKGFQTKRNKIIYEDFNCSYDLLYTSEQGIVIAPYERNAGYWKCCMNGTEVMYTYHTMTTKKKCYVHLITVGKVNNLSEITTKDIQLSEQGRFRCSIEIQPQYGYAGYFLTEDKEKKFIRLWLKDYELSEIGSVAAVTVQYQLY